MAKRKKKNIKKRQRRRIALGLLLSLFVIIYLVGSLLRFKKITPLSIEVAQIGNIDRNIHVNGVIIRNETVVKSKDEGNITYLAFEGEKVKGGTKICMVGDSSTIAKIQDDIKKVNEDIIKEQNQRKEFSLVRKDIKNINYQIDDLINKYMNAYSNRNYSQLYSIRSSIELEIEKKQSVLAQENSASLQELVAIKNEYEKKLFNNSDVISAPKGGIVSYYFDGLEEKLSVNNFDKITEKDLKNSSELIDLSQNHNVKKDSPVFKIVDNYSWYIVGSFSNELVEDYKVGDVIYIKLNGIHNSSLSAEIFNLRPLNNDKMLFILRCTEQMPSLMFGRNVELEIIRDNYEGIKIPINSIVEKVFLKIPKKYIQESANNKVLIKRLPEKDELITVKIEYEDNENVYILEDFSSIKLYDTLVLPENAQNEYVINKSESKVGVFVVNGGIIRFKPIKILAKNNEYAIVDSNLSNGIKIYDQIVSNATNVKENQLLNQFNIINNQ